MGRVKNNLIASEDVIFEASVLESSRVSHELGLKEIKEKLNLKKNCDCPDILLVLDDNG